jgi:thioredoxin-related protein
MRMKLPILIALVFATTIMTLNALPKELQWITIVDALDNAPKANKKIVLDVYTDWCGWCKRMDRDVYSNDEIQSYIENHYVTSKMNPEKQGTLTYQGKEYTLGEFSRALGIRGFPSTVFFDEKGEVLTMISGYQSKEDFMKILTYFGDDHYLTQTWDEYMKGSK